MYVFLTFRFLILQVIQFINTLRHEQNLQETLNLAVFFMSLS